MKIVMNGHRRNTEDLATNGLTPGKAYEARFSPGVNKYIFKDDKGRERALFRWRFDIVPEPDTPWVDPADSWNPETRGPQMANPQARTIFKYQVPTLESFELDLPQDAQLIRIAHIDGFTWAWAVVDLRKPKAKRKFRAFKTGATIPDDFDTSAYVGFYPIYVQMELGLYVFEETQ